ncbi:DUF1833 family protein [Cupriavidus basilensis]|uniref:DUF1833 family protein n=1 Tax=Cupriavidus basilensis TaxID=68895 RepID=A0ABT6AX26_9BURK|nr:DUF1833 family protein [Cupriavidus basilensis]MDF3837157.1 DUF1833 family protein [Cupriavidus basilensis]
MTALKQALAEAYASAPADDVIVDTLEIRHPSFVDDNGPTAIRICRDRVDFQARLEPSAPMHPGALVTFLACPFDFTLPGIEEGRVPQLQIKVDNVDREITAAIESAYQQHAPIEVTYRPYLVSDTSGPQMDPPVTMVLTHIVVNVFVITGTATLNDVHNWPFPNRTYSATSFPGLTR